MAHPIRYCLFAAVTAGLWGLVPGTASAVDWLTLPSTYTHDAHGVRVEQYAQPAAAYAPQVSNFRTSGYTHARSSLQFGPSADNYHRVEKWGDPVRPYGEWRFPYRPYAQPYAAWGAPLAGLGPLGGYGPYPYPGVGYGGYPGNGAGYPGDGDSGGTMSPGYGNAPGYGDGIPNPYPSIPGSGYEIPPYYEGHYPSLPHRPRLNDRQFFRDPRLPPPAAQPPAASS